MFNKSIIFTVGCILFIGVELVFAQTMHPGWPQTIGSYSSLVQKQGVVVYEDSNYGWLIGAARSRSIAIFRLNGELLPGWPQTISDIFCSGVSMGDIDGDGSPEIVCCSRDFLFTRSIMYVWHIDGRLDSSLSRALIPPLETQSPTLADLDEDGSYELLYANDSLRALDAGGVEYPGFPIGWGADPPSYSGGLVVGNMNGNNIPDILWTSRNLLHAMELGGRQELPGWPVSIRDQSYNSAPIMIPTDRGTYVAMVLGEQISNFFNVYVWNWRGEINQPWPIHYDTWHAYYISAGDVDGDGEPELLFQSGLDYLYVYHLNGGILGGFPLQYPSQPGGKCEISIWRTNDSQFGWLAFSMGDSYIYLTHPIEIVPGFPVFINGRGIQETIAIIPPQNDTLMIAFATKSGPIAVWDVPCSSREVTIEWQMGSANPQRNAVYQPITITSLPLGITLTPHNPPVIIPAGGGSFAFDAEVYNMTDSAFIFDVWTEVILPNTQVHGPLLLRRDVTLPAGAAVSRELSQYVPAYAPSGGYSYVGKIGVYPDSVTDSDDFMFVKLLDDSPENHDQGWNVYGWDDDEEGFRIQDSGFRFLSVSPNPFNASTALSFKLQAASNIKLAVYDIAGREVAVLAQGFYPAGAHRMVWDAYNASSGIYFVKLTAGKSVQTQKLLLLK